MLEEPRVLEYSFNFNVIVHNGDNELSKFARDSINLFRC